MKENMGKRRNSLAEQLNVLLKQANKEAITVKAVIDTLAGKGQAALLILLSLPFCQPIQIPGFSTPFGIVLAFIGLRIAFGRHVWIPKMILDKKISYSTLNRISSIAIKITEKLRFFTSTRIVWLVQNHSLHIFHGLTIALLSMILALPLPIPFSNLFAAFPILAFGFGIVEDDGLMIILAYILTVICFSFFTVLIWFGKEGFSLLLNIATS